jgi:hypothetical protein
VDTTVAAAVLDAAEHLPKKLKIADAETIVRRWLRALPREEDRWGNFHIEITAKERESGIVDVRYHFTDRQLQRQVKYGSDSEWRNRSSQPLLEAANTLITKAATALGRTDIAERATKIRAQRVEATEKRARAVVSRTEKEAAFTLARKYLAKKYRDDVLRNYTNVPIDPARLAEMKGILEFQSAFFQGVRTIPGDETFASIDLPPILPVFGPISYEWVETEGGQPYSVFITNKEKNKAIVKIGAAGGLLDIDPVTMRVSAQRRENIQGDGWIDGYIVQKDGKFYGVLVVISALNKKVGAGTRLLNLWCRLMAGYGITRWVAVAVGDEGAAFFNALEKRGRVRVDRRDVNWVIACL